MCSFFQLVFGFRRPLIQLGAGFDLVRLALKDSLVCMWLHGYGKYLVACNLIGLVCMWLHGYGKHDMECMVKIEIQWNVNQIGLLKEETDLTKEVPQPKF